MKLVLPAFGWFQRSNQVIWLAQQEALAPWFMFMTFYHCLLPCLTLYFGKADPLGFNFIAAALREGLTKYFNLALNSLLLHQPTKSSMAIS